MPAIIRGDAGRGCAGATGCGPRIHDESTPAAFSRYGIFVKSRVDPRDYGREKSNAPVSLTPCRGESERVFYKHRDRVGLLLVAIKFDTPVLISTCWSLICALFYET